MTPPRAGRQRLVKVTLDENTLAAASKGLAKTE